MIPLWKSPIKLPMELPVGLAFGIGPGQKVAPGAHRATYNWGQGQDP